MTRARDVATQGGLTLISTQTLTASAGVAYTNLLPGSRYRILISTYGSVDTEQLLFRFREGSTNKAASYFGGSYQVSATSAGVFDYANNISSAPLGRLSSNADVLASHSLDYYINPNGNQASVIGNSMAFNSGYFALFLGFNNSSMATCDGFYLFPASGTITGSISLYKYNV